MPWKKASEHEPPHGEYFMVRYGRGPGDPWPRPETGGHTMLPRIAYRTQFGYRLSFTPFEGSLDHARMRGDFLEHISAFEWTEIP